MAGTIACDGEKGFESAFPMGYAKARCRARKIGGGTIIMMLRLLLYFDCRLLCS